MKRLIPRWAHRSGVILTAGLTWTLVGCDADPLSVANPEGTFLWASMNVRAATLAMEEPYNTIQLSAIAYRGDGTPIPDVPATYAVSDESLTVTETGLVTAVQTTAESYVVARLQYGGITRTDTTRIHVVEHPFTLSAFEIDVDPNAPIAVGTVNRLAIVALDGDGWDVSNELPFEFRSSNGAAEIDRFGFATGQALGTTIFTGVTTVFGVTYRDSITVDVGYPQLVQISMFRDITPSGDTTYRSSPNTVFIGPGGVVRWFNGENGDLYFLKPMEITFSDPDQAQPSILPLWPTGSGNVGPFVWSGVPGIFGILSASQSRRFMNADTITFTSPTHGISGTIIIR